MDAKVVAVLTANKIIECMALLKYNWIGNGVGNVKKRSSK